MKKHLSIIIILLFPFFLNGQSSYLRLIEKGKYNKTEKKIHKELIKAPDDIELNLYLSILLLQRNYEKYNTNSAYIFLLISRDNYKKINDANELKKLAKNKITLNTFSDYLDKICSEAYTDVVKKNTEQDYQLFLDFYTEMPNQYRDSAIEKRNTVAFSTAIGLNTPTAFQNFMNLYPFAQQYNEAESRRNALEFESVRKIDKIDNYKEFILKYRNAAEVNTALERIYEIAFIDASTKNTSFAYKSFMKEYPNSRQYNEANKLYFERQFYENTVQGNWLSYKSFIKKFPENIWISSALDSIYQYALINNEIAPLDYCVSNFEDEKRTKCLFILHDLITNDSETSTLDYFYNNYNDEMFDAFKISDYDKASKGDELLLHLPFNQNDFIKYDHFIKLVAPNERAFVALQRIISLDLKNKDWNTAIKKMKVYENLFIKNKKYNNLIEILEAKYDFTIKANSIGTSINTTTGGEYSPVISIDDQSLFFCGKNRNDNIGGEDIYVSVKNKNKWSNAVIISDLSAYDANDAPLSISPDGNVMLLFKSGKIFYSEKKSNGWSKAHQYSDNVNTGDWQSDAMITSDGKSLIFTATGLVGQNLFSVNPYNFHGDNLYPSDVFVSTLDENGNWSVPVNLGKTINTPYSERTPFLHPDMKTLYFSSDGHGGLGKLDVFKSTRLSDTCWTCWSEPINMGKEINTFDNDLGYKISTAGDVAYFSYELKNLKQSSVILLIDISGSMAGYKLNSLIEAAYKTCQNAIINNAEISIITFSGSCYFPINSIMPFTKDINDVAAFLSNFQANGGTPLYEAYNDASGYMAKYSSKNSTNKVILLMTDGDANGCTSLIKTLNDLKNKKTLYQTQCIAYDVSSYSNAYADLQKIATTSKGNFYYAESSNDLGLTFEKASSDIFNIVNTTANTDIMTCNLPAHLRPGYVATVSGLILDKDNKPVSTNIKWEDLETGSNIGQSKTDPADGIFFIVLPLGKIYGYYVDSDDYFPISNSIDLRDTINPIEMKQNINIVSFKQMINDGSAVPVNNLFFSVAKSSLLPYSIPELKRVALIIKKNSLKVEISGHTDSDGDEIINQKLSEQRALAVKDFLINEGCNPNNLIIVGYGETKPIVSNDTEEGKAKNRRVELRFIE